MCAHLVDYGSGPVEPEAASSVGAYGVASVVAHVVAFARLNLKKVSAQEGRAAQAVDQIEARHSAPSASVDKLFLTLRARLELKGHILHRTHMNDEPVHYYAISSGLVRELRNLADVERFHDSVWGDHA